MKVAAGSGTGAHYTVSFDVTNTGKYAGATVAQVYVADGHASVPRPLKELKGFERVSLKAGETRKVSVSLDGRSFAYYDVAAKKWTVAPGEFGILVGDSSENNTLKGAVTIQDSAAKAAVE